MQSSENMRLSRENWHTSTLTTYAGLQFGCCFFLLNRSADVFFPDHFLQMRSRAKTQAAISYRVTFARLAMSLASFFAAD